MCKWHAVAACGKASVNGPSAIHLIIVKELGLLDIFEFKVVEESSAGQALGQIRERDYAAKYRSRNQAIHRVGVEFSKKTRNIVAFDWETIT